MSDAVLVTGAFGLLGRATVRRLARLGRRVVATDQDTPANRAKAAALPAGVTVEGADLAEPAQVAGLIAAVEPASIINLAAINKVDREGIIRASALDWVILRLGGVLSADISWDIDPNLIYFEGILPTDGRLRTLLIGGDDTHRLIQGEVGSSTAAAMGLVGALPVGRKGDPTDDNAWFATDWMDSSTAQDLLGHQHHSWPQLLAETAENVGWKRYPLRMIAPLARQYLRRRSPYYRQPGRYAQPWDAVRRRWGAPEADRRIT